MATAGTRAKVSAVTGPANKSFSVEMAAMFPSARISDGQCSNSASQNTTDFRHLPLTLRSCRQIIFLRGYTSPDISQGFCPVRVR